VYNVKNNIISANGKNELKNGLKS